MDNLVNNLIRPYRFNYTMIDLGKKKSSSYDRYDSFIQNDRGLKIYYSYYKNRIQTDICMIYCHCNSGCRVQGIHYLNYFIQKQWNVLLFDFSGSGLSEGDTISLGYYEAKDLKLLVSQMQKKGNKRFLMWGRSMGASTIIFYLSEQINHSNFIGCILDSPYADLWTLSVQIGVSWTKLPRFIVSAVLSLIRSKILADKNFDIKFMDTSKLMKIIKCPLMFLTSLNDEFLNSQHVIQLYKLYEGPKRLQYIQQNHNSTRCQSTIMIAIQYLDSLIKKKKNPKIQKIRGDQMAQKIIKQLKQIRKFKSFKLLRCKQNIPENHKTQNQDQDRFQQMKSKIKMKSKILCLKHLKNSN